MPAEIRYGCSWGKCDNTATVCVNGRSSRSGQVCGTTYCAECALIAMDYLQMHAWTEVASKPLHTTIEEAA